MGRGIKLSKHQTGIDKLIPCIRDTWETPMAAILAAAASGGGDHLQLISPIIKFLAVHRWVPILAEIGQPGHVQ